MLSKFFLALRRRLAAHRRDPRHFQALAHLNDHLLRDIGLRIDQGVVMPFADQDVARDRTEGGVEKTRNSPRLCPRCGEPLT
ncbi:hypothetical protein [Halomonas sp. WWR20]